MLVGSVVSPQLKVCSFYDKAYSFCWLRDYLLYVTLLGHTCFASEENLDSFSLSLFVCLMLGYACFASEENFDSFSLSLFS